MNINALVIVLEIGFPGLRFPSSFPSLRFDFLFHRALLVGLLFLASLLLFASKLFWEVGFLVFSKYRVLWCVWLFDIYKILFINILINMLFLFP